MGLSGRITLQSQRLRWLPLLTPSRYAGTRDGHQRIVDGILNSDLKGAAQTIRNHLQSSLENYIQRPRTAIKGPL
ncbi:FCD domain-containing protein [Enterocloster citroniae]|uniref:FCD domain-containing protein n=1 Tax=Enterocloster citroniae TaxID=358743 RepID=A0AA41K531_9FIRM|nr:FCD domain-containing protein [Enterocloster citroniae]MBS1482429.1 FCD domain-containing protein [Clostridium sp.]MBT9808827.1 FCD domain-containing protein [Enterocloster citroniae]MCC3383372.1 FCD domain-containing protein [Enterocloster citroniae]RGC11955.1 FCD domain-containing protein [Enterocloster citroniae]